MPLGNNTTWNVPLKADEADNTNLPLRLLLLDVKVVEDLVTVTMLAEVPLTNVTFGVIVTVLPGTEDNT